jgi:hypothetical protein
MNAPITDEQLQAIEERHRDDLEMLTRDPSLESQGEGWATPCDIRDLLRAIRERDATIAELRTELNTIKRTREQEEQYDSMCHELQKARAELAELRKPVTAKEYGPTLARDINALPDAMRRYVHDLETRADPSGDVRQAHVATETANALEIALQEVVAVMASILHEYDQTYDASSESGGNWTGAATIPLDTIERAKTYVDRYQELKVELRKPVAVERNETVERFRDQCKQYGATWGADTHIISVREASKLFDAYDTLAQNHARAVNAREMGAAEMRGIRERLGELQEERTSNEAMKKAEQSLRTRLADSQERERHLRELLENGLQIFDQEIALHPDANGWSADVRSALTASPAPVESAALAQPQGEQP